MTSDFNKGLCTGRENVQLNNMTNLTPQLYKEVLKYKGQESNYLMQTIDLASYSCANNQNVA